MEVTNMLEFSEKKVVGKIEIPLELTEYDIENIIVTGLEGGIGYWACLDNNGSDWEAKPKGEPVSTWATKLLIDGKSLRLLDEEDREEGWLLTLDKILEGYRLNYINRPFDNNIDNGDIVTADCIIQYGLFGKLVYG
jgi:hypothetical protein